MSKKVLVINEGYSDNLGDQAINESIQYLLKDIGYDDIVFQDFTKNIDKAIEINLNQKDTNKNIGKNILRKLIPVKLRWTIKNLNRMIKISKDNYDLVVIGGGQLILSNATFSIAMFLWVYFLKLFGTKKIVLIAVGIGTRFSLIDKLLYKITLDKVSKIYARDTKSQEILKRTFDVNSNFIYDVAFMHNKINKVVKVKYEQILLGVISFDVYKRYNKSIISKSDFYDTWLKLLNDNHIDVKDVKLFYTTQDDRIASLEFQNYIKIKYQIDIELIETNSKDILIKILNESKLVVSARMHALILGLTYECNIITYPISDKLIEFDNMFNADFNIKEIQNDIKEVISEQ